MIKTFTQDDVIRYIYHETSKQETSEIEQALVCDTQLQDTYNRIYNVVSRLDSSFSTPSQKTTNHVMQFARHI